MKFISNDGLPFYIKCQGLVVLIPVLFVLLAYSSVTAAQNSQKTQTATTSSPAPAPEVPQQGPAAIAVTDVATRATDVANLLQGILQKLTASPEVETIRQSLLDLRSRLDQELAATAKILEGQPALPTLQAQQQQWEQLQAKTTDWLSVLTKRSTDLQEALDSLTGLEKTWEATFKASQDAKAPGLILQEISGTLASIQTTRIPLQAQITSVLDLQSGVSGEVAKCGTILAKIARVQQASMSGILVQDSLPIVSPELWAGQLPGLRGRVSGIGTTYVANVNKYLRDVSEGALVHARFLALLIFLFLAARYRVRKLTAAGVTFTPATRVFDHPIGAALTMTVLLVTSPYWPVPAVLLRTFQLLAFAPMILLIRLVLPVRLVPGLHMLWLLIAIDVVREAFSGELLIGQIILLVESLGGIMTTLWFLRRLRTALGDAASSNRLHMLQSGAVFVLLILLSSLAAAAMGYMRLARLLTPGIIAGGTLAFTLYVSLRICIALVDLAFHVWPFRTLGMIQHNRGLLERRLHLLLVWAAIAGWTIRYLSYVGFLQPSLAFGKTVLHAKYERGDFSISVGGVLEFFITIWAAYLLSALLRFVLREDVYPRIKVAPGKSYAVSSLLHYVLIALGFIAGIAVLGVNLTKLTVLTGALGVGIGFGLQSVVNNFVSGLILLFERPVQVGDTVEVGDLLGKVRRIGIRACTVHTRQGADIIVPNSQLISEKVTNWTLSDMLRRVDLPVGVSYSSVPKEVIKVLERVAIDHHQILADPPPQALFMGYGDSSINFELRAWTDRFDDWQRIRSELATAVFDAVRAAGMSFPFPQREVRLLNDPWAGGSANGGQQAEKDALQ